MFEFESSTQPRDNPFSWHYNASMVYIETPVGVGYNEQTRKTAYDDENVSYENLASMKSFFKLFPELAEKETYLTGESYAGIYIPYLAKRMLEAQDDGSLDINFGGIMIGNGVTNYTYDKTNALVKMAFAHGLIDLALHEDLMEAQCDFNMFNRLDSKCSALRSRLNKDMKYIYNYDIYRPVEEYYNKSPVRDSIIRGLLEITTDHEELAWERLMIGIDV